MEINRFRKVGKDSLMLQVLSVSGEVSKRGKNKRRKVCSYGKVLMFFEDLKGIFIKKTDEEKLEANSNELHTLHIHFEKIKAGKAFWV